jgi:hypothetical protein
MPPHRTRRGRRVRRTRRQRGGNTNSRKSCPSFAEQYNSIYKGVEFGDELRTKGITHFLNDHPDRREFVLKEIERALKKSTECATSPFGYNENGEPTLVNGISKTKLRTANGTYTNLAGQVLIKSAEALLRGENLQKMKVG